MEDVNERHERVLLRPWLESMLETGDIPGLEWFDRDLMMFKVPWKHRSKKDWSIRHSSVFLEWARNTGRWSEGDPTPYFAQLKTRLRCAFNKAPDIEEMKEFHSRNCEEPFKVYRFTTRKTGNGLGGPGSVQRTTVTISAPRRIAPVKTEMFADEDVHYSDVENVRTEFSLGYYKDLMATSGSGARSEQAHREHHTSKALSAVKLESSGDQKFSVIPITVEELSSADSDDSVHDKSGSNRKQQCVSSSQSSDGAQSKLLMLQMASMFVEAEASRQLSTDDAQASVPGESKPNEEVRGEGLSAPSAIDLTAKDQLGSDGTEIKEVATRDDVMDLTATVVTTTAEAVDLTQTTDGRILPLPRCLTNYSEQSITSLVGSQALKTSRLSAPVHLAPSSTPSANDTVRSITSLTIRSRPLFGGPPIRLPVTSISTRITLAPPLGTGRLMLTSPNTSNNGLLTLTQSIAPVTLATVPVVTVPRIAQRSSPIIAGVVTTKPLPVLKKMMIHTAQSDERPKLNLASSDALKLLPQQQNTKIELSTRPADFFRIEGLPDGATTEEIRRHYYAKEQLLMAKAQTLLEKEKQLLIWEKQLLAKHETLYWKERCMKHENRMPSGISTTPTQEAGKALPTYDNELASATNKAGDVFVPANQITVQVEVQTNGGTTANQIVKNPQEQNNFNGNTPASTIAALLKANRFQQPPIRLVTSPLDLMHHTPPGAALETHTPRIVLPTFRMIAPGQQKPLRILPAPRRLVSQASPEPAGEIHTGEKRVLPPVSLVAKTDHLPVCVIESNCSSDQLSPTISCEAQESSKSGGINSSVPDVVAVAASPSGSVNVEPAVHSSVLMEQIRMSAERVVRQYQTQASDECGSSVASACDDSMSLETTSGVSTGAKSPGDEDVVLGAAAKNDKIHDDVSSIEALGGGTPKSNLVTVVDNDVDCAELVARCDEKDRFMQINLGETKMVVDDENSSGNLIIIENSHIEGSPNAFNNVDNNEEVNQNERSDNKRKLTNDVENANKVKIIRTM